AEGRQDTVAGAPAEAFVRRADLSGARDVRRSAQSNVRRRVSHIGAVVAHSRRRQHPARRGAAGRARGVGTPRAAVSGQAHRSGMVAIIGRPNVGKSTLINALVGERISIVSRRPQTTRHRILGIKTTPGAQIVYVDTPGLHEPGGRQLNRYMSRLAAGSVAGVDAVMLMISADGWHPDDEPVLDIARRLTVPVILVINKIDRLKDRATLLPLIRASSERMSFAQIMP